MIFEFKQPDNLKAAKAIMAEYGDEAKIIAGGTAVVAMMGLKLLDPQVLVSLGRVPGLAYEREDEGGISLGSMVLLHEVQNSPRVKTTYPALARACGQVGNIRVRNQATLGGNLAEADYASDPPTALLALEASVTAVGPNGSRTIPVSEFLRGFFTTALQPDEILTVINLPPPPKGARSTYLKFRSRSSEDLPLVGVAAVAAFDGDACLELRLAVGAACEVPRRISALEDMAVGNRLGDELIAEIAEGYALNIDTVDDVRGSAWYRKQMIRVHVERALREVGNGRR